MGFRITEGERSFTYIPDHEPAALGDFSNESPDWIDGYTLAADTDVLLHDSQYSDDEYATRRGWGHSSFADAVAYAKVTRAKRLLLFHHDPTHDDATLEAMETAAQELWGPDGPPPQLAASGMTITLEREGVTVPA
jgi:hypothetical protein